MALFLEPSCRGCERVCCDGMCSSKASLVRTVVCSERASDVRRISVGVLCFKGEIPAKFHVGIGAN
eukprot:14744295-Ditylum_brightwellii.AAC.1